MSASFYDLQKYAATGIASPEMTHYDKMQALSMAGGTVQTLTGVPPLSFKSNGKPLISLSMLGNAQQQGTPSPQSTIMPEFVGVRTANLFDISTVKTGKFVRTGNISESRPLGEEVSNDEYDCSDYIAVSAETQYTVKYPAYYGASSAGIAYFNAGKNAISGVSLQEQGSDTYSFTTPANCAYIRLSWYNSNGDVCMLNTGSTALPYEPYGWKVPITCAGQTTPVYLGQMQTVRNIYKLVLTGDEGWGYTSGMHRITISENLYKREIERIAICTHYEAIENQPSASLQNNQLTFLVSSSGNNYMYIRDTRFDNTDDFKAYLAAQYANGTPVVIWYVLAEPETGIVNEPLCKIGDYADELHITNGEVTIPTVRGQNTLTVDTDLQPSEMTITYTR